MDHWVLSPDRAHARGTRSDARRFELWERSPALVLGLGAAARKAQRIDLEQIRIQSEERAAALRWGLRSICGVNLVDPAGARAPLISFTIDGVPAERVSASLWRRRIAASVSHPRSSPLAMDVHRNEPVVRVSPHYCTEGREIDVFLDAVTHIAREER